MEDTREGAALRAGQLKSGSLLRQGEAKSVESPMGLDPGEGSALEKRLGVTGTKMIKTLD